MSTKPAYIFDRDPEWADLEAFADDDSPGPRLGIVSGRRRQGKTFLLDALCQTKGGFYFAATEATETESLRQLGDALGARLGSPAPLELRDWEQVIDVLLRLGAEHPVPVVLDEFPYLAGSSPSLPSIVQKALGPGHSSSQARLLLCGSAMGFMGRLLSGSAPLRGRAGLELIIPTLDFRLAAEFWGITDPVLAVLTHAVVGGTPAYGREYVRDDVPRSVEDFDDWVVRAVLNPASPLFREARYLLAEEVDARDTALYHSVLAAVAEGNTTRGGIAGYIGRKATDIAHPLHVLEDSGLLEREQEAFRAGRTRYRIIEPLITFYQSVMRPSWTRLERRRGEQVWRASRAKFMSNVVGPHFEGLCRAWARDFAEQDTFGELPGSVGVGVVNDADRRTSHEIDVAVLGGADGRTRRVLSLGEAKWGEVMGLGHLGRLERVRTLLADRGYDTSATVLACYSGAGFDRELLDAARGRGVALVDLDRLYGGG